MNAPRDDRVGDREAERDAGSDHPARRCVAHRVDDVADSIAEQREDEPVPSYNFV